MESCKNTSSTFDVIVVGGGIMGSCAAYQIAKRGHSTFLLEQFDFLHNKGSSHGHSRTFRTAYPVPHYHSLLLESSRLWQDAQSHFDGGYQVFYPTSSQLDIGPSDEPSLQALITTSKSNSLNFRLLESNQLNAEFPGKVVVPEGWIGVLSEGAAVINATKAVEMFQALAVQNGALLRDNVQVTAITREEGQNDVGGAGINILVSTTTGDKFYGKKCVVTVGAWMNKLVQQVARFKLPLQPLETTLCYWKIKEGFEKDYEYKNGFPTFASYGNPPIYGTPSLEYPGLIKVAAHGGKPCGDPDHHRTWAPDDQLMEYVRNWVRDIFNGRVEHEDGPVLSQSCMYTMTPDDDFVIDFLGEEFGKDVVIAGGFSGHGFKMAPAVGRVVADLALHGNAQGLDLAYFKISRFSDRPELVD